MKKFSGLILTLLLFRFSTSFIWANKCGVNIGSHYSDVERVIGLTKPGGWVVALGTPGNCANFENLFGKNLNVVIRAYNGGKKFTNPQALGWVATLGKLDSKSQVIYFMPWNEPNHDLECGNTRCTPAEVANYVQYLKTQLNEAGLLNTKVILLSPMIDKLNPRFEEFKSIYSLTNGSSINEYDQFSPTPCSAGPTQNNCLYDQIDIPPPYYAIEAGVAGTCLPPCYRDNELVQMLSASWLKWKSDGNFKMFAIFSYDPHRPGSWDIFSAPQVKNFYSKNCQAGAVALGSFNKEKFDSWFLKNEKNLISCGGCGYTSSQEYCEANGFKEESEIINPESTIFCADLDLEYKSSKEEKVTPTPISTPVGILGVSQQAEMKEFSGSFRLEKGDFPDLSPIEILLSQALEKLLPENIKEKLSLDENPLKSRVKHFISGKDKDGKPTIQEKIPETEVVQPGWFTRLLGVTKIICGIFNVCPAPKSLTIKVNQPDTNTLSNSLTPNTPCPKGKEAPSETLSQLTHIQEEFKTTSWWTKSTETNEEPGGKKRIKTEENAQLQDRTRGAFVGSQTLSTHCLFLNAFLPPQLVTEENYVLKNFADYWISEPYQIKSEEVLNYQSLAAIRTFCLQQCALLPPETDISSIYSFCPSCNPNEYSLE